MRKNELEAIFQVLADAERYELPRETVQKEIEKILTREDKILAQARYASKRADTYLKTLDKAAQKKKEDRGEKPDAPPPTKLNRILTAYMAESNRTVEEVSAEVLTYYPDLKYANVFRTLKRAVNESPSNQNGWVWISTMWRWVEAGKRSNLLSAVLMLRRKKKVSDDDPKRTLFGT